MLISLNWINDFTKLPDLGIHDIANDFTMKCAEVEEVIRENAHLSVIKVSEIKSIRPHPEADKLNLVTFDYGAKDQKEVVCGAPNLEVGQKVPYAPLGVTLPNGLTLEPKKIRGILSDGMLCSEVELGIGSGAKGLMQLPKDSQVGLSMAEYLKVQQDYILDVDNKSLTHRPDLWGLYGIAREFAAMYKKELKKPFGAEWEKRLEESFSNDEAPISIKVDPKSSCRAFWGLSVDGIKVEDSPKWMQDRLISSGLRPINNIVDVSNYVMLELGMPLHIYDRELINGGKINVALSEKEQTFITLDEFERKIIPTDTLISDAEKPLVLAGIMGGANSGVNDNTKNIFIEVANWQPEEVRRTSVRLGLRTDSSSRYEKSLDNQLTYRTLLRTLDLIQELCPEAKVIGKPQYDGENLSSYSPLVIKTSKHYINNILGTNLSSNEIISILNSLAFSVEDKQDTFEVTVPSYRATKDIEGQHDLAEEIGRIVGYDSIPVESPKLSVNPVGLTPYKKIERKVQDFFSLQTKALEVLTYPLVGEKLLKKASWNDLNKNLVLVNALSKDADRMRPSLIPSFLEVGALNAKNFSEFKFFEWGRTYHFSEKNFADERNIVGVAHFKKDKTAFLELLNTVENFLQYMKLNYRFIDDSELRGESDLIPSSWLGKHPHEVQHIMIRGKVLGGVVSVHPLVLRDFKVKGHLSMAFLDLTTFTKTEIKAKETYKPLAKFPAAYFDCTVLIDSSKPAGKTLEMAKKIKIKDLKSVSIVEVYELNDTHKSVTLRFCYENPDKTLEADLIKAYEDKCVSELEKAGYPLKI